MLSIWADFLTKRDIHVVEVKCLPRVDAVIELLYRDHHIQARNIDQLRVESRQASDIINIAEHQQNPFNETTDINQDHDNLGHFLVPPSVINEEKGKWIYKTKIPDSGVDESDD